MRKGVDWIMVCLIVVCLIVVWLTVGPTPVTGVVKGIAEYRSPAGDNLALVTLALPSKEVIAYPTNPKWIGRLKKGERGTVWVVNTWR